MQSNHSQKLSSFRQQIRRNQLDSFFAQKRIILLQQFHQQAENNANMEIESNNIKNFNPQNINLEQLITMSKFVQSEQGIQVLHHCEYEPYLIKFLGSNYVNSDQQYHATYILCNLYYNSSHCPSQRLTQDLLRLLEQASMKTLDNIFFMISNTIHDYPDWLHSLLNSYQFGQKLVALFQRFPNPNIPYLQNLVQMVFKIMQRAGRHTSFMKLQSILLKFVLLKENADTKDLIRRGIYAYYTLFKAFPEKIAPIMIKGRVLEKMINLVPFFNERRLVYLILEIIEQTLFEVTINQVENVIIPFLIKLSENRYEVGQVSKVFQPRSLKILTYDILKKAMECDKLSTEFFSSLRIAEEMFDEFTYSEDPEILASLAHIFVQVWLNSQNEQLKVDLSKLFERARLKNPKNFELEAYLHEFENYH